MVDRQLAKPEIASQKVVIKLPPAIGDWTTYRPPKILIKKVKTGLYGFDRLSRKELNQVMMLHYNFTQAFFHSLQVDLGLGIEFYSVQAEQTTYLNFLRTMSDPVVQGKLLIPGIHEGIQFFLDLNLANSLINHALGSHDLEPISRGLTEAENRVIVTTITEYLAQYVAAFEGVIETPSFSLVGSPDVTLDPSLNTSATFVSFSAEASFNDNPPGKITFGYLASTLKRLVTHYATVTKEKQLDFSKLPSAALNKVQAPVKAILGKTSLLTNELHQLEIGDVVSLDSSINSAVTLTIGNLLKLQVQPGTSDRKKAIRITSFGDEEIKVTPPVAVTQDNKKPPLPEVKPSLPEEEVAEEKPAEDNEDIFDEEETYPEETTDESITEATEEEFPEEDIFKEEEFPEDKYSEEDLFEEETPEENKEEA